MTDSSTASVGLSAKIATTASTSGPADCSSMNARGSASPGESTTFTSNPSAPSSPRRRTVASLAMALGCGVRISTTVAAVAGAARHQHDQQHPRDGERREAPGHHHGRRSRAT